MIIQMTFLHSHASIIVVLDHTVPSDAPDSFEGRSRESIVPEVVLFFVACDCARVSSRGINRRLMGFFSPGAEPVYDFNDKTGKNFAQGTRPNVFSISVGGIKPAGLTNGNGGRAIDNKGI
jgi:hypothetical protein